MSLRNFILALVTLPLATLLLVGGMKTFGDYQRYAGAKAAVAETSGALRLTSLAHFLQAERGRTAGYLASGGTVFAAEMKAARREVDAAAGAASGAVRAQLGKLAEMRAAVDGQRLKVPQAGAYYTGVINGVLEAATAQLLRQGDPQIVKTGSGLIALNAAKESAGLQRAAGAQGFGSGSFGLPVYTSFAQKGAAEAQFLQVARAALPQDTAGMDFAQQLRSSGLASVREAVIAAGPGGAAPALSGSEWFEMSSGWISHLREVEISAADQVVALAERQARSALITLAATGLIMLLAAGGCIFLGLKLLRTFDTQFGALQQDLDRLSRKDFDFRPAFAEDQTEIGRLSRAMETTRASLQEAEASLAATEADRVSVIGTLDAHLGRLADRDLDCTIAGSFPPEYDQLRRSFNTTVTTLNGTFVEVADASHRIRSGASEISSAADNLSQRTEGQAATLEQTAASLDELTASVKSAAESARSVETTMSEARHEAENSGEVVQNAVTAMTEIEQSSAHISQIINVIDDIAFQTNLLALNAGVEAARAGEAGRGFAVVASEVRGLAQRSADAATEIKSLISSSSQQVERGVDLVGKAGAALDSIVGRVNHISQLVSGIAEGAAEQSTGLDEINTGVVQLDQVTQQNAAMVEETNAAGHLLSSDADKLAGLIDQFRLSGAVTSASPAAAPSAPLPDSPAAADMPEPLEPVAANSKWQDF